MSDPPNTRRFDAGKTEVLTVPAATAAAPAGVDEARGDLSARYVAGAEIARGGMGRVMAGTDTRLGREVAIKEALPQGGDLERFEREVRITARLEHPSIVPLYDVGVTAAGRPFYVMRKVSGQPLERLIAERAEPAEPVQRRRAADQRLALLPHVLAAAHALGHAHRRGVIHRDVKPANILVGELGETVVIDWGLAKVIGEDEARAAPRIDHALAPSGEVATQTGAVFGTPSYMAPEQARAEPLDARSDVYAIGATLYHVLAGRPPLPGHLTEVLAGADDPRRAAPALAQLAELALPPELTAIIDKAMQFDPDRRYPDGAALADDLNRFLAGRLVAAHRYTAAERLGRFVRRHRALVAVIATSAIVLAAGGVAAIRGIVLERERAWQAEQAANAGRREAEAARQREAERADEAVIVKAHTELERDPTAAIATLKTLPAGSRRWPQARSIAIEARLRGIAQVYGEEAPPRAFELGPDPRLLLAAGSTPGKISIIDLEHNRERELAPCPGRCIAAWAERGAAVWIGPEAGGLYAVDLATGARRAPVLPAQPEAKLAQLRADPAATLAGFTLRDGRAATLDAGGMHYLSGLTGMADEVRVSPDGTWAAFASRRELVIVDRGGRELARETGALRPETLTAAASGSQLAILTRDGAVLELTIASQVSVRRTTPPWAVIWLTYVNDDLYINLHDSNQMRPLHALENGTEYGHLWGSRQTLHGYLAVVTSALQLIGPGGDRRTLLPPVHDQLLAIAGRRNARYLAVHARNSIMTWDLAEMLPDPVATGVTRALPYDDHTSLIFDESSQPAWLDLATGVRTPIAAPLGLVTYERPDPATDRELLVIGSSSHEPPRVVIAHRGRRDVTPVDLPGLNRVDLAGSDLIVGTTSGELILIGNGAAPRGVHRFDAAVDGVTARGPWIVGRSRTGTFARVNTATGATDTERLPFDPDDFIVTATGDVYLATDRTLVRWRGRGTERIATVATRIAVIEPIPDRDRLVIATRQNEIYAVAPDLPEPRRTVRLSFRSAGTQLNATARYLSVSTPTGETTFFDLTNSTQWRLPSTERATERVYGISPTGRTAMLFDTGRVSIAHLDMPDDPAGLRDWVVHATNYTSDAAWP